MLRLSAICLLLAILTGCDNQPAEPITRFVVDVLSFDELDSDQTYSITFTADAAATEELSIAYELREKSANFQDDLVESSGTLVFPEGSDKATLEFTVKGDTNLELQEEFEVVLYHENTIVFNFLIKDNDTETVIMEDSDGFYTPLEYPSMRRVWSDEFDGTEINMANWTHEVGEEWFNNELQAYSADPKYSYVADGKLSITAYENGGNYTSARMITQDKYEVQYGRIDIRARLPKGQGIWPALWMLGEDINEIGWPKCGEIDIMELLGHIPNETHGTAHYDNNGHQFKGRGKSLDSGDFIDQFHVFSIVWERDYITWYLDGEEFLTLNENSIQGFPFTSSYFFIFNVAVGGNWPGNPDDTTEFPQTMEVDYIRVFQ